MSSAESEPHLEDTSSVDDYENNDLDKNRKNSSVSKTETQDKVEKNLKKKYVNKMLFLLKEFVIMVILAVIYAAIANDPPKVGKSPAAYRFFSEDSYVIDWYRGEISDAINQARSADIAFVMFYAPWDAECQHARKEFQTVAGYMHEQVTFSAVNCWQPGSECKMQYNKVQKWPVLIAYPTHGRGIQYNGPLVAAHMISFLKKLIYPFSKEGSALLLQHDALVLGRVKAAPYSRQYNVFYQVALRLLERDPLQQIGVAVETEPPHPSLEIHFWNKSLIYDHYESGWEVEPILNWIMKNVQQTTSWISPSGTKSISLSNYLQPGPALILFTPRNPLAIHNDFYSMLRGIAYDYNHRGEVFHLMTEVLRYAIKMDRREKYLEHLRLIEKCNLKKIKMRRIITTNLWSNTSYCFEKRYQTEAKQQEDKMVNYYGGIDNLCQMILGNLEQDQDEGSKQSRANILYKTSKLTDVPDYRSPENLKNAFDLETCRYFQLAQRYYPLVFSSELYNNDVKVHNITGLKFKANENKTLSFIAMDSLRYHHYAEKLGIDLSKRANRTAVVIMDNKMESHYIMSEDVSDSNVRNFIYNYTTGLLERALSSLATVKSQNTHSYPNNRMCSFENEKFCVKELSAADFLETISESNKAVIIFYYSKQCSFCNGISYRFLTVAKYFSSVKEIQFARVDGDLNLLPWEYTMEVYPTILFIPANQGSESRVFPMEMQINLPNLIGFILANLQSSLRLEAMWTLCTEGKFNPDIADCISSLRQQITQTIEKTLQEWRTSEERSKSSISLKLQHLHDLHTLFLQFSHNSTLAENILNRLKLIELKPPVTYI